MRTIIVDTYEDLSLVAARLVGDAIGEKPDLVLGLPTGRTPVGFYAALVQLYRQGRVDFSRVVTFNLDEYYPMDPRDPRSFHAFMQKHLLEHVNVPWDHVHIPDGRAPEPEQACAEYEHQLARAGGIDLLVLGIGHNGHIGFNEPGAPRQGRTGPVRLAHETIQANFGSVGPGVPRFALSMGIGTILESRKILLLASGQDKASITRRALLGPVTPDVPASFLQLHPSLTVILDRGAAAYWPAS